MIPRRESRSRVTTVFVLSVSVVALAVGGLWGYWTMRGRSALEGTPRADLPVIYPVPDFRLLSSQEEEVTRADLAGRPWVANFIFTTCTGTCPIMNMHLVELQESLPEGHPARFVSITVDPRHDTPEVLREYAARYGARPDRWLFLTGQAEEIYTLARDGFRLAVGELPEYDPERDDGPFFHSKHLVLVDSESRIRGFYDGTDRDAVPRLLQDLQSLS